MSSARRFMLLSCLLLTLTLWGWAWQRHEVHTHLVAWPFELWSILAFVEAFMSSTVKGRKWSLSAAVLLFFSIQAVQAWQVVMPHADWLAAGMPTKPLLADLSSIVSAQVGRAMSLSWVAGCSQLPRYAWAMGAPFCLATLLINSQHPIMPTWSRYMAGAALVCWACSLLLLTTTLPIVRILDATFALAMGLTVITWVVWYVRMDAIHFFDLLKQLDSPSAQEGADKYTRE